MAAAFGGADHAGEGFKAGFPWARHTRWRLVGQGRTNAEIGATLFISRKTASVHVSNILRKLGAGSRVQAATMAASAGLIRASESDDS